MIDKFSDLSSLEDELRRFAPAVEAGDLQARVARQIGDTTSRAATVRERSPAAPWGDRCLAGAMGLGLAAAVVIATMLGLDLMEARTAGPSGGTYAEAPVVVQAREYLAQLALGGSAGLPLRLPATAPN